MCGQTPQTHASPNHDTLQWAAPAMQQRVQERPNRDVEKQAEYCWDPEMSLIPRKVYLTNPHHCVPFWAALALSAAIFFSSRASAEGDRRGAAAAVLVVEGRAGAGIEPEGRCQGRGDDHVAVAVLTLWLQTAIKVMS